MFRIYHSNHLDLLKDLAVRLMTIEPLSDPFITEQIIVESSGISEWLQLEIAKHFNIASNINFLSPSSFIWDILHKLIPNLPEENRFTKINMTWKVMHKLPLFLQKKEFSLLRKYIDNDDDNRKLYQLSVRIANLFEQYLIYRPDWLINWEKGYLIDGLGKAQNWQALLWRDLISQTNYQSNPMLHTANLYQRCIEILERMDSLPSNFPKRIFIFAVLTLPPIYLKILEKLSRYINIHFLFTNPCRHYWADIEDYTFLTKVKNHELSLNKNTSLFTDRDKESNFFNKCNKQQQLSNPLLASWGKIGSDSIFLLNQLNVPVDDIYAFVDVPQDNLLHDIQSDILNLNTNVAIGIDNHHLSVLEHSSTKRCINSNDRSITIQVCHSIQREVEVLQDYLLCAMETDHELKPRDIIVMVTNIDKYTPFIQATFSNMTDERYLPFTISHHCTIQKYPIILALLNLMKISESRFTAEEILGFLEIPAIARKFLITENNLCLLRRWIMESGIRWGFDDTNVKEFSLPSTGKHTWIFGLQRMLLGYAMNSNNGDWRGILPYDASHGSIAELIGYLGEFLSSLEHLRVRLSKKHTLHEWQSLCNDLINTFFIRNVETQEVFSLLEMQWNNIIEEGICSYKESIPISLLYNVFCNSLNEQRINQQFFTGSINFCSLISMRSIPFKIICLLGMNDGVYPHIHTPLSFDLMKKNIRKGDYSTQGDDRYVFLETFLSAQNKFYISYIGRSIKDNTKLYPSVIIEELIDYISQNFYLIGDEQCTLEISEQHIRNHLHTWHSRLPFAAVNFQIGKYNQSFASEWLPTAIHNNLTTLKFVKLLPQLSLETLLLEQLLKFWQHPIRAWFHQRLNVHFEISKDILIPNNESFLSKNLHLLQIKTQLLNALIAGVDTQHIYLQHSLAGNIPYGTFGEISWQNIKSDMQKIALKVRNQYQENAETWEVNIELHQIQLIGWLTQVQNDGLLRWRSHLLNIKDGLLLWLEHLVYCALGGKGTSRIYGLQQSVWCFKPLTSVKAKTFLKKYINGYQIGMMKPLMLLNKCGGAWLDISFDVKSRQLIKNKIIQKKAINKLRQVWYGNFKVKGDGSDPYVQRLSRMLNDDIIEEIINATCQWYLPILQMTQDKSDVL
ncbi:exodeoxyribonuclease V subunit gamma [Pantoea sp. Mhis]|uniref:exodeoxyribonuclease V subunit gamma n=1 Tax=Pantoea sp. Mhis TaxID=2576759 RepID=UPI00135A664B|nr:exodeoxyribonuclease V subunit gamma [Pantoea sp. Mhis]MXP56671.1 exodeoxyribonuclease V subunit gamma [Pantoea sp. Mhis]